MKTVTSKKQIKQCKRVRADKLITIQLHPR